MANIGVQLMMVRDQIAAEGMYPVLERIAGLGYRSVEVSQVPTDEANIAALERAKAELGLEVAALSVSLKKGPTATGDALDTDFDKIVADCRRLDCRFTRIGMMPIEAMVSRRRRRLRRGRRAGRPTPRFRGHHAVLSQPPRRFRLNTTARRCSTSSAGSHPRCTSRSTCIGCNAAAATRWTCCASSPDRSNSCTSRTTEWPPCPSWRSSCSRRATARPSAWPSATSCGVRRGRPGHPRLRGRDRPGTGQWRPVPAGRTGRAVRPRGL